MAQPPASSLRSYLAAALLLSTVTTTAPCLAKISFDCPYTLRQTFSASVRLVRVDHNFPITEKDADAAYILFEYHSLDGSKTVSPGAIEMVPTPRGLIVHVSLPKMPRYHEQVLVDRLRKKLTEEYGEPPKKPAPKPPPSNPGKHKGASNNTANNNR